ncbi:MAG: hypothetical protein HRU25_14785 [Psychrobium sp.]|nr:hypothetical protein [Psychrobium sp.]
MGPNQQSFLATSERRVERTLASFQEWNFRDDNEDGDKLRFSVTVQTQEGDSIVISFSSAQGNDEDKMQLVDSFALSYEVDDDLSESEHQALTQILAGIGELADDFFAVTQQAKAYQPHDVGTRDYINADFNLDFLSDFDNQQLAGFDLT